MNLMTKRKRTMKQKLKSLMTTLKSKSWSMVKRIGHLLLRSKDCSARSKASPVSLKHVAQQRKQAEDALQKTDAVLQAMLAEG